MPERLHDNYNCSNLSVRAKNALQPSQQLNKEWHQRTLSHRNLGKKLLVSRCVQVSIISHGSAGSSHCHVNISHILGSGDLGKQPHGLANLNLLRYLQHISTHLQTCWSFLCSLV